MQPITGTNVPVDRQDTKKSLAASSRNQRRKTWGSTLARPGLYRNPESAARGLGFGEEVGKRQKGVGNK